MTNVPRGGGADVRRAHATARRSSSSIISPLLGVAGILIAYGLYGGRQRSETPSHAARIMAPLPTVFEEKFGFDIAYDWLFYKPAAGLARLGVRFWEGPVVGGVAGVGAASRWTANRLSLVQNGIVRTYAVSFALGLAALTVYFLARGG